MYTIHGLYICSKKEILDGGVKSQRFAQSMLLEQCSCFTIIDRFYPAVVRSTSRGGWSITALALPGMHTSFITNLLVVFKLTLTCCSVCRPAIIVRPYSAEDVAIVVTFAVRHRFQVTSHHHYHLNQEACL